MHGSELHKLGLTLYRKLSDRLDELLASDFPTESPRVLGDLIRKISEATVSLLESTQSERIEKYALEYLQALATTLRYLETASSAQITPSIVTPIETIISRIKPGARVMVHVESEYNYSISDIAEFFQRAFTHGLGNLVAILGKTTNFFIVAVPAIEYSNVLLHSLLGHELGHRIAEKYLALEDQAILNASVTGLVGTDLTWYNSEFKNLPPMLQFLLRQEVVDSVLTARHRTLHELISDATAQYLLGFSALFAVEDFSSSDILDALPDARSGYYPPWRYRIRQLISEVDATGLIQVINGLNGENPIPLIRQKGLLRLEQLRTIAQGNADSILIAGDGVLSRAYHDMPAIMNPIVGFIRTELANLEFSKIVNGGVLVELLQRLALGIPPDEAKGAPPDFRLALAAGWLYRTARIPIPFTDKRSWEPDDDDRLNRLVLKAIESVQLVQEYKKSGSP